MWTEKFVEDITKDSKEFFIKRHSVLSFAEYLELVSKNPSRHLRNCAQYFFDMVESFGSYSLSLPTKKITRYKLFDADFINGEGKIFGQESVQGSIVNELSNFVRAKKIDKLVLLHGPNGSAKTSIVKALTQAAEYYSTTDEGALYQFSWVFPNKKSSSKYLGFSDSEDKKCSSFARLNNDMLDSKLTSELKEHPLLLLSAQERKKLFNNIAANDPKFSIKQVSEHLLLGDLSFKNRQIFDSLLLSYHGDLSMVLKHIKVERFYYSKRYKSGISVVEPQMSVDVTVRQVTSDQSLLGLPSALRHLSLYEVMGPLVEANRGLIEYSDLLKRPIDAWKYLLIACEQAQVSIGSLSLFFDFLMLATSNELHLKSFKEYPDWQSFKGRIELVRVPYLLRSIDEEGIYKHQIKRSLNQTHVAPHSIELAARWAVLTRLEPPEPHNYPEHLRDIIVSISPQEKLDLYNLGRAPSRLSQKEIIELKSYIKNIANEFQKDTAYEGMHGASPREIKTVIFNAAQNIANDHLSVEAVFSNIEELIQQKSSYEFLRREPVRGYRDANFLLQSVKKQYLNILEDEIRTCLGFYSVQSYSDLFARYMVHVSAWTKSEQLVDPLLGKRVDADDRFMSNIEDRLLAQNENNKDFRYQLISHIGAFRLENPEDNIEYSDIFSSHITKLKERSYHEQEDKIIELVKDSIKLFKKDSLAIKDADLKYVKSLSDGLLNLGYNESSSTCALSYFLRYKNK